MSYITGMMYDIQHMLTCESDCVICDDIGHIYPHTVYPHLWPWLWHIWLHLLHIYDIYVHIDSFHVEAVGMLEYKSKYKTNCMLPYLH